MRRNLTITSQQIDESALIGSREMSHGMGAAVYFSGVVRGSEDGAEISSIDYEAFAACQWLIDEMKRVVPIWKKIVR